MSNTLSNDSLSAARAQRALPHLDASAASLRDVGEAQRCFDAWNTMIEMLRGWQLDPRAAIDDDYEPPSQEALGAALELARSWRSRMATSATRMGPTGAGGISFEWRHDPEFREVEVERDGSAELLEFIDCKLVGRTSILYGTRQRLS